MSLHKTNGIVFHTTPYGNTSIVAKIYTEQFGLQSYIVNSVRSAKAKNKNNYFQPLSLVSLVVYHKPGISLQRISEISFSHTLNNISGNIVKTTQTLFITEVLYRSIKEEEKNAELFHFIQTSVLFLDAGENGYINFHLLFLLKLSVHLGFKPDGVYSEQNNIFNLSDGIFQSIVPVHPYSISGETAQLFSQLNSCSYKDLKTFAISKSQRDSITEMLLLYFQLHLPGGFKVISYQILKEISSGYS